MAIFPQYPFEQQMPPQPQIPQQPMMGGNAMSPFIQGQPGDYTYAPPQLDEESKKRALKQALFAAGMNLLSNMKPTPLPQSPMAGIGQAGLAGLQQYNAFEKEQFDRARDLTSGIKSGAGMRGGQLKGLSAERKNPVFWDPNANMQYEVMPTGEKAPYFGSLVNVTLGDTPGEMLKSMGALKSAHEGAVKLKQKIEGAMGKMTGPVEGRTRAVGAMLMNDPEFATTQSSIYQLMTDILQAKSGLTVSDTERKIYETKILPMLNRPDQNVVALTQSMIEWLERVYKANNDVLQQAHRINLAPLETFNQQSQPQPESVPGKKKFTLIPGGQ